MIQFIPHNNIMLTIYLICLTTFLVPICSLITSEIYKLYKQFFITHVILKQNNNNKINAHDTLIVAKIYIRQKKWRSSLVILESAINTDNPLIEKLYNSIGFCYYHTQYYELSKYYYSQAIKKDPIYISALNNLAEIHTKLNEYKNAHNIYQQILNIDPYNKKAKQNFKILLKKTIRDSRI